VVALAINTGIPYSVWISEPPRALETALELMTSKPPDTADPGPDGGAIQMSG
jgi:hypothetical protein